MAKEEDDGVLLGGVIERRKIKNTIESRSKKSKIREEIRMGWSYKGVVANVRI